ncbi:MAG: hypothetical protein KIS66_10910 [Fimbriimonadaceae bacterium]|nr:hypothetical protein [Fimbriimonadaceae bacterium]
MTSLMLLAVAQLPARAAILVEAEEGTLVGTQVSANRSGYSGRGYVTNFSQEGDRVVVRFEARAGLYEAQIRYAAESEKGFGLSVNGVIASGMFEPSNGWRSQSAGKVELRNGVNEVALEKGWGWFDVDRFEFRPAAPTPVPRPVPAHLADRHASTPARELFARLRRTYGAKTLSGQYDLRDTDHIKKVTRLVPAIYGSDLIEYSPSRIEHGADPKGATEGWIKRAKTGQILTLSWHWNAPKDLLDKEITDANGNKVDARWYKGFYANATTFDAARALADPKGEDYRLILRDIDAIATELMKLDRAGIPVLWRPLHEAEGGWFWWGAKGPGTYKALWRLMFDRLHGRHGLHNLIWVHTGIKPDWYPGDKYVDVVGVDLYPSDRRDALSGTWETLLRAYDGKKLIALTEVGGVPDVERMFRFGVRWSYFVSWTGSLGASSVKDDELRRLYGAKKVGNLGGR